MLPSYQVAEPQSVCLAQRVMVDFEHVSVKMCQGQGCHNDFYDGEKTVFFKKGLVQGRCEPVVNSDVWNTKTLVKTVGNWLVRGWDNVDEEKVSSTSSDRMRHGC